MYTSLIIGSGMIAGGYDDLNSPNALTHAHAYINSDDFKLLGFYDIDYNKAVSCANKWNSNSFKSIEYADVYSICTPDNTHLEVLKELIKFNPKLVFLEKPVGINLEENKEIIEISKTIPIVINYSRRFIKEFQELNKRIKSGEFGIFYKGYCCYGKGFNHNGSHLRDLVEFLIGPITKIDYIDHFIDYSEMDPTNTVILHIEDNGIDTINESKKVFVQGIDSRLYSLAEFDFYFTKGRIRITNGGSNIEIYKVKENSIYAGYFNLVKEEDIKTNSEDALKNALENISNYLNKGEVLISTPYIDSIFNNPRNI